MAIATRGTLQHSSDHYSGDPLKHGYRFDQVQKGVLNVTEVMVQAQHFVLTLINSFK